LNYFLDSYAIIEIIEGNSEYVRYASGGFCTSLFNLYEVYHHLLKNYSKSIATYYHSLFKKYILEISDMDIALACEFKIRNNDKNISYVDALGYAMAWNNRITFLTGDKEFKNLKNVEYVK
jgi:uncharacterized protein